MRLWVVVYSVVIAVVIAGGMFMFARENSDDDLYAYISEPILTTTPTIAATPTITPTPTPAPTVKPTAKPTSKASVTKTPDPRLAYVRAQLISAGYGEAGIDALLNSSQRSVYPAKAVAHKEPNWQIIKDKMYAPAYVEEGRAYLTLHEAAFAQSELSYGVPSEALAGLIALETDFGRNMGNYVTFNALYSRMTQGTATNWQSRAGQLVALSKHCLNTGIDCYSIRGSYAGAFGLVQFIPTSLLSFGVDGNADGLIDLSKPDDAIPSAANYLKLHGWADDPVKALTRYYGSSVGYPEIVLHYAELLK